MANDIVDKFIKDDIVDDMVWSFSRLSSFKKCKRMWYLTYIKKVPLRSNFFSEYGTFAHLIFEKYNKGEMELFDILPFIEYNYNSSIITPAPPNAYVDLGESYYNKLYSYFEKFNGYEDETIGVEKEISFTLNFNGVEKPFTGYIDRLSKTKKGYKITDYKSKGKFKNKDELEEYLIQPYLYSQAVKNEFKVYPKELEFDMFKENTVVTKNFELKKFNASKKWALNLMQEIYDEIEFPCNYSEFFCKYICSCSEHCPIFEVKE